MATIENVNIERSQTLAHVFNFLFSGGNACLIPFITLFFKQIGLTGLQTGIVIGVKCFATVCWGPLWLACANRCKKRRFVLMLSITMSIASALLLTLVPATNPQYALAYCKNRSAALDFDEFSPVKNESVIHHGSPAKIHNKSISIMLNQTKISTVPVDTATLPSVAETLKPTFASTEDKSSKANNNPVTPAPTEIEVLQTTKPISSTKASNITVTPAQAEIKTFHPSSSTTSSSLETSGEGEEVEQNDKGNWDNLDSVERAMIKSLGFNKADVNGMSEKDFVSVQESLTQIMQDARKGNGRHKRDIFATTLEKINHKLAEWKSQMDQLQYRSFLSVLVIILITELLSAPVEKLADSLWFEFLDGFDFLERYGSQRVWSTLGVILFPLIVTFIVDQTPCELMHHIHHFMIHFYMFAAVMSLAFMFAFCYPIYSEKKKIQRKSSTFKGFRILCNDIHGFCYVFTILLLGIVSAGIDNFLFWRMQEFSGSELFMGGCLTIAGISQFIMFVLSRWLVRKVSNAGAVVMALMVLAGRLVLYSFMWDAWPALIISMFHGFSHTLMWASIENYPDFKVNPFIMDRNAKTILYSIYIGIGYGGGSLLTGYLYDLLGFSTMMQGAAIMVVVWCILFALVQRCVKRKSKVRYAKLLQAEEDQDSDESTVYEADWLEVALNHDKR